LAHHLSSVNSRAEQVLRDSTRRTADIDGGYLDISEATNAYAHMSSAILVFGTCQHITPRAVAGNVGYCLFPI
jgi:hypothetical protein